MSTDVPDEHLRDILAAIGHIQTFLSESTFEQYARNVLLRSAVERQMQILTEAAGRLGREAEKICPGPDWRNIRGLGNVLRHEYDRVLDRLLWDAIENRLPPLKIDVTRALRLLAGFSEPEP